MKVNDDPLRELRNDIRQEYVYIPTNADGMTRVDKKKSFIKIFWTDPGWQFYPFFQSRAGTTNGSFRELQLMPNSNQDIIFMKYSQETL